MNTFIIILLTMLLSAWRNWVTKTNESSPKDKGNKQSHDLHFIDVVQLVYQHMTVVGAICVPEAENRWAKYSS